MGHIMYDEKGGKTTDCDDHMFSKDYFISCELLVGEVILPLEFWLVGWLVGYSVLLSVCVFYFYFVYTVGWLGSDN